MSQQHPDPTREGGATPVREGDGARGDLARGPSSADPRTAELQEDEGPIKRHGDALRSGTGNRHGVHDADERPET